jgi:DNA replication protein DnaC
MTPPLPEQLAALGLRHTAAHLDDVLALATKRRWSPTQLLEHLVEREQQERTRRSLERRLTRSRLGRFTPMTDFDWAWPKHRPAVEAVLRLGFLPDARNVVLVAAQGLGKTMIAQNIAHAAVLAGTHVLFTTASQLLLDLGSQESTRALARRLNYYATHGLLVIDEVGYLSYDARAADLLFQGLTRRYEKRTSCSPPTCRSAIGRASSRTPAAPSPSSIASSTTPKSSPSQGTATGAGSPRPSASRPGRGRSADPVPVQIPALLHVAQHELVIEQHRERRQGRARRITIDFDPTDDLTHGQQEFTFFHGHYDTSCYLPLLGFVSFDTESAQYLDLALLRPGNSSAKGAPWDGSGPCSGCSARLFPGTRLQVSLDGGFAGEDVLRFLEAEGVEYVVALARNPRLDKRARRLLGKARMQAKHSGATEHVYGQSRHAARKRARKRRIIIKAEVVDPVAARPADLVTRQFTATRPNRFSRRIVGWRVSSALRSDLARCIGAGALRAAARERGAPGAALTA